MHQDYKSSPLERYIRILELLAAFPEGLGLSDVARLLGLPKTSTHRLLGTLQSAQLITLAAGAVYVLGHRMRRLAHVGDDAQWVTTLIKPHLADLAAQTGETCYLAKLHAGHQVSSVMMESPDTPWRGFVLPGKVMAPHAAASAKAILAFQAPAVVDAALMAPLSQITAHTCTDPQRVRAEYAWVREHGYATCIGEIDEELIALGVPIHDAQFGVLYSLGLTGPRQRLKNKGLETLARIMMRCGERIATSLATVGGKERLR